ncbi:MAG: ectonucleotide pyrophosphatase/phosphodiesterase [Bacteroidetes bacterium]|nr:ectonucleotide pyrophosphatase/phosphodiesterase [Bacteroidota bacterium]
MKKLSFLFLCIFYLGIGFAAPKPYVILISFDGFRWDYLNRNITPNLEKVRENGVSAISLRPAFPSKTFPNHLSIITGMYPSHHGIIANNFYDPFKKQFYRMQDTNAVRNERWYLGEAFWETAERQGITTASYFWPGSELTDIYRRPTYREFFDYSRPEEIRLQGVIDWLKLPAEKRPHFITLYFQNTDTEGHKYGPNSPEVNEAIKKLDSITGLLFKKLDEIKMKDSVNVIFVSDHGMTNISHQKEINIEKIIGQEKATLGDLGPTMMVFPKKENFQEVYNLLKQNENHYKVYLRNEVPTYFHYSENPFISPIVLIADLGWSLVTNKKSDRKEGGNHGYDNNQLDMHGIFLAIGPNFKTNYYTGTLWNIDIYPLLCEIFNIVPRSNIDGKLERIEFLLKGH